MALPRVFARARTMSARLAGSCETDMSPPWRLSLLAQYWRRCAANTIRGCWRSPDAAQHAALAAWCAADPGPIVLRGERWVPALRRSASRCTASGQVSPPRGAVLFVLRLDLLARLGPVGVGPVAPLIEVAAHRQHLAAIHGDGLAVDPVAAAGNQEHREILQLFHLADAAHRVHRLGSSAGFVAGLDALAHAFGRNFAGRNSVEADAITSPFGCQRHRHGMDRGLAHRRRHDIRAAVADPGDRYRHYVAGILARDPASAYRMGHIERPVHDDVGDRVEAARRKILGARDEIAGGVVDEIGERPVLEDRLDHLVDSESVADIDRVAGDATAIEVHQFRRGFVADDLAAASDLALPPDPEKAPGHPFAEPGPPTGHKNTPPCEELFSEHGRFPSAK